MLGTTRRSLIPVRWVIHSSDVVKQRASRWLSTTQSGTAIPVPMIFDLRMAAFRDRGVTAAASLLPALESCQGFGIAFAAGACGAPIYSPVNRGGRFSKNARRPSRWSALAIIAPWVSASQWSADSRSRPGARSRSAFAAARTRGGPSAIRRASGERLGLEVGGRHDAVDQADPLRLASVDDVAR